jgi:quinol monooxygenase YgiN
VAEFDRLAERAAEGVRTTEPDTLVYVIHVVPKAPMQRIIYEIYRDRAAFEAHERQSHIQRFVADRRSCVLATNIIDLRLKYAKVAALATSQAPQPPSQVPQPPQETQVTWTPRALESASGQYSAYSAPADDGYAAANGSRYLPAADQHTQYPGAGQQFEGDGQYAETGPSHAGYADGGQFAVAGQDRYPGPDDRDPRSQSPDWTQSYYGRR